MKFYIVLNSYFFGSIAATSESEDKLIHAQPLTIISYHIIINDTKKKIFMGMFTSVYITFLVKNLATTSKVINTT